MSNPIVAQPAQYDSNDAGQNQHLEAILKQKCLGIVGFPEFEQFSIAQFSNGLSLAQSGNEAAKHIRNFFLVQAKHYAANDPNPAANENWEEAARRHIVNQFNKSFLSENKIYPFMTDDMFMSVSKDLKGRFNSPEPLQAATNGLWQSSDPIYDAYHRLCAQVLNKIVERSSQIAKGPRVV